jgi:hypothetical protein
LSGFARNADVKIFCVYTPKAKGFAGKALMRGMGTPTIPVLITT